MAYLSDFQNIHKGETCIILGNGPSLKQFDWEEARARWIPIFGTNRIYLSGQKPDYYVAVNDLVIQQFHGEITDQQCHKFLPARAKAYCEPEAATDPTIIWINTEERRPIFRKHPGKMWEGFTVTYVALQIAFQMGFEKVILFGVDHYFHQAGQPNLEVMSQGPDPDHFDPNYFGKGTKWNLPDLEKSEVAYSLAKLEYERAGRTIVNASHQTKLKVFPLANPNTVLSMESQPVVSAIISAYYAEKYLDRCIQDLMNQDLFKVGALEIIAVCKAGSEEHRIMFPYNKNVNIISTVEDDIPSIYEAWNLAIEAARGEFITNANCDDQHHPGSMALQAKILTANPNIDLVYHDQYITWDPEMSWDKFVAKERKDVKDRLVFSRTPGRDGIFKWGSYSRNRLITGCFIGPQPMWRKNLHQRYGMFDATFESAGDYDFWLRVAGKENFFYINEPMGLYLAREDGKELSDPGLSQAETLNVMIQNTSKFVAADLLVSELARLQVGDEFITTTPEGIQGLNQHIQNQLVKMKEERMQQ